MTIDIDKLEELARAATPGPWSDGRDVGISGQDKAGLSIGLTMTSDPQRRAECEANAELIASTGPDTILALVARLREVEADAKKQREHLQVIADMVGDSDDIGAAWESVNALREERGALAHKLARIELLWDRCEGVPNRADMGELHQLIIDTGPHADEELAKLRRQSAAGEGV